VQWNRIPREPTQTSARFELPFRGSNSGSDRASSWLRPSPRDLHRFRPGPAGVLTPKVATGSDPDGHSSLRVILLLEAVLLCNCTRMRNASAPLVGFHAPSAHDRPGRPFVPGVTTTPGTVRPRGFSPPRRFAPPESMQGSQKASLLRESLRPRSAPGVSQAFPLGRFFRTDQGGVSPGFPLHGLLLPRD